MDNQEPAPEAPPSRLAEAMKRPVTGAAIAAGVVLGASMVFGLGEVAVGAGVAYLAYRMLKKKQAPENK